MKFNLFYLIDCFLDLCLKKNFVQPKVTMPIIPLLFVKKTMLSPPDYLCIFGGNPVMYVCESISGLSCSIDIRICFYTRTILLRLLLMLKSGTLSLLLLFFFNIVLAFFLFGSTHAMQKFPGQGSNLCQSSDPSCCSDSARSLTCCATENSRLLISTKKKEKKPAGILLYMQIHLERIGISIISNVLVHEHDTSLHLFRSSLTLLISV